MSDQEEGTVTPSLASADAADTATEGGSAVAELSEALAACRREAEASHDRYLRALAELDNARKRAARDREEYVRYATETLLRELLPVLDNFDRALQAARDDAGASAVLAGVELVQRETLRILEKFGVTAFTSVGAPFDPARHEAIARVPAAGQPEMTVVAETVRGYLLHGRVLRPAMVTVAMTPEPPAGAEPA